MNFGARERHQHAEDNEMQTGPRFRAPFVVARVPSKAIEPAEAAFNHQQLRPEPSSAVP